MIAHEDGHNLAFAEFSFVVSAAFSATVLRWQTEVILQFFVQIFVKLVDNTENFCNFVIGNHIIMGKKVICFIFYYFVIVYSFGQDMYTEKIKWEEHVESVSYVDTCDIVLAIKHGYRYKPRYYTKMLINSEYSFFCIFVSIGSGIPSWGISVYIKNDNHWNMIARGAVVRPVYALTARFSANEDKILFFTVSSGADKVSSVLKSLVEKEEEIGELSLGKFLH